VQSNDDPQVFVFELPYPDVPLADSTAVLLSPLIVKDKTVTDTWLQHNHPFLDVLASAEAPGSMVLPGSLTYALDSFETSGDRPSTVTRPNGYKPLRTFDFGACSTAAADATPTTTAAATWDATSAQRTSTATDGSPRSTATPETTTAFASATKSTPGQGGQETSATSAAGEQSTTQSGVKVTTAAPENTAAGATATTTTMTTTTTTTAPVPVKVFEFVLASATSFNPRADAALAEDRTSKMRLLLTRKTRSGATLASEDITRVVFWPVARGDRGRRETGGSNLHHLFVVLSADVPLATVEELESSYIDTYSSVPLVVRDQSFALTFVGVRSSPPLDLSVPPSATSDATAAPGAGAAVGQTASQGENPGGGAVSDSGGIATQNTSSAATKAPGARAPPGIAATPETTVSASDQAKQEKVSGSANVVVYTVVAIVIVIFLIICSITMRSFVCKDNDETVAQAAARYDMEWGNPVASTPVMYANNMGAMNPRQAGADVNDGLQVLTTSVRHAPRPQSEGIAMEMKTFDVFDGTTTPDDNIDPGYLSCSTHI